MEAFLPLQQFLAAQLAPKSVLSASTMFFALRAIMASIYGKTNA